MSDEFKESGGSETADAPRTDQSTVPLSDTGKNAIRGMDQDGGMDRTADKSDKDIDTTLKDVQALREQQEKELQDDLVQVEKERDVYRALHPEASESHIEERGIVDVPVADLPWPEDINGPQDFDRISHADAVRSAEQLQEMKPFIDQGYTSDDFKRLDKQNGMPWENGQQRVYDLFYGSDPVKVLKDGDNYIIDKGRHRIYAAKEAGLETLPVRLQEKVYH